MQRSIDNGNFLLGFEIESARYFDSGNKFEYLKTIIEFGLEDGYVGPELRTCLAGSFGLRAPAANRRDENLSRRESARTK